MDQKIRSLEPVYQWWFSSLMEGQILGSDFGEAWPTELAKDRLRGAFRRYAQERNIYQKYTPDDRILAKVLSDCVSLDWNGRKREDGIRVRIFRLPSLEQARREWETYIGHQVKWES